MLKISPGVCRHTQVGNLPGDITETEMHKARLKSRSPFVDPSVPKNVASSSTKFETDEKGIEGFAGVTANLPSAF